MFKGKALLGLCALLACWGLLVQPATAGMRNLTPEQVVQMRQAGQEFRILDVRTPEERSQGTIPGSQLVSVWDVGLNRVAIPDDKPLLLFCAVGTRSSLAAQILARRGNYTVYNLVGGIAAWAKAGLPVVLEP